MCRWWASERGFSRMVPVLVSTTTVSAARMRAGSPLVSLVISWVYTACAFFVAVARTYSNGARVFGRSSAAFEGMISMLGRPRREMSWRRRGEAEARITRFWRRSLSTARESGGGRGSRGAGVVSV